MKLNLEFYIDIYFLINFTMDVVLLLFVRRICKRTTKMQRILIAAAVGALCACLVAVYDALPIVLSIMLEYFALSLGMILIAFRYGSRAQLVRSYIVFLLAAFFMGGVMQSLFVNLGAKDYLKTFYKEVISQNVTIAFLVIISFILTPLIYYGYHMLRESTGLSSQLYDVTLYVDEEEIITCKGFMDTGNCLKDPIRGWPVIVVDKDLLSEMFMHIQANRLESICVIPYVSVGKEHGLLYGIRIPKVIIKNTQEEVCTKNVVAALSEHGFLNTKEYRALLHCDLLGL